MSMADSIRMLALANVVDSRRKVPRGIDPDYPIRRVMRAYAERWHTPLAEVEKLPLDDILLHFFEHQFEGMDEKDLEEERGVALQDPDELALLQREEDRDDMEVAQMSQEEVDRQKEEANNHAVRKLEDAVAALQGLSSQPLHRREGESALPQPRLSQLPPDVDITFSDPFDENADTLGFGLLDRPKSR